MKKSSIDKINKIISVLDKQQKTYEKNKEQSPLLASLFGETAFKDINLIFKLIHDTLVKVIEEENKI